MIKKPLLKRETRKLVEKKLAAAPSTDDVLTSVYGPFLIKNMQVMMLSLKIVIDYMPDNKDNWNPNGIAVNTRKVCIV